MTEFFDPLGIGLANVFSWPNILIPLLGTVLAMIPSFLPGIGAASLAAIMIAVTVTWEPVSVLLLFGALTGGATFMGSITAILFNIPGNASSAAVLLDGHPMARDGQARMAIAASATASAVGSLIGVLVLIALLPAVRPLLLQFGPAERFLFGLWGLVAIIAVPNASALRALAATLLGLTLALVGSDPVSSAPRWTFGAFALFEGFGHVAMLLGFFTLAEVISWRRSYDLKPVAPVDASRDSARAGIRAVFRHWGLTGRSALIGTAVGMIPGVGGTVASFVAYAQAAQGRGADPARFGQGDIRGVIAPEAAVDAKDGGSLLPVLAFGLPGSEGGVILLSVLTIHGLTPGAPMLTSGLGLSYTLIFALLLSNLVTSALGLALAPQAARLTRLRIDRLALPVLLVALVTSVQLNGTLADLHVAVGFALLGYLFKRFDWPRIPFVIAFVLGGFIETNLQLSQQLLEVGRLQPLQRPGVLIVLGLIALSLWWMLRKPAAGTAAQRGPAARAEPVFAALLLVLALGLAVISLTGAPAYSGFAQTLVWSAVAVLALILTRGLRAGGGLAGAALPAAHRLPFVALAALPLGIWLLGLPLALAALVGVWVVLDTPAGRWRIVRAAVWAGAAGAGVALYLERVAAIRLPPSLLASAWGGLV
ncbi:hypothetical protein CCR83_10175 [Rhodobacter veldkampii DSM 11550]|uniref:Tricarboxylic transporter n=1 Tax=Phaeovulum veldkampii DSM 11550 TaxID=1185920 RepID=A0A2T4JM83_9RHOB|nr:tripartite tricarboxylate transporter permease [Phaeovulum veldkampii]MBK5946788.1 hypothetical protein [Phaeovulum veldkampii DSM 11550]PTE18973.1 tricarboxylic transporter [Phaeovulum veldkampii DSM 11550]TDQ64713.1 putative tricarboxylic transport membrane protein [Phaeovulum veldkampii DSM 11550]